jgi:predicted Zn-dependent peptidase
MKNFSIPNRSKQPRLKKIQAPELPEPTKGVLNNGLVYYVFKNKLQDVVKIDVLFRAGSVYQNKKLVASTTAKMLKEGTKSMTASKIAERLDHFGAYLETSSNNDRAVLTLFSLKKNVRFLLPLLAATIYEPVFGQQEFNIINTQQKQEFLVNSLKPKHITNRVFIELVFGPDNPYGRTANEADFDALRRDDLIEFHQDFFLNNKPVVIFSGHVDQTIEKQFIELFSSHWLTASDKAFPDPPRDQFATGIHWVDKPGSLQSAFKMGVLTINRFHADYPALLMLNTVLGGYFGSRLMSNIREDKGYTYGINSSLAAYEQACVLSISSEVGREVTSAALAEVQHEINKLRTTPIPEHELSLVRNYLSGNYLRNLEGPLTLADNFRPLIFSALGMNYYKNILNSFQQLTSEELKTTALKYLDPEKMVTVVTGEKLP